MKKIYFFTLSMLCAFALHAQVQVTFQVDLTDYLAVAGNTLKTVKIAGNFVDNNAVSVPQWEPTGSPVFANLGNNIWAATINFAAAGVGKTQEFKFLNTANSWGACNTDQECLGASAAACAMTGSDNRKLVIPSTNTTICFKWETCTSCLSSATNELTAAGPISLSPNPFSIATVVTLPIEVTGTAVLTTVTGQAVQQLNLVQSKVFEVNRQGLSTGIYFLSIRSAEGAVLKTEKLIVQ